MIKRRKKTGSIAIPFLITFLISMVLIGGTAMIIYDKIDDDESSLIPMTNEVGTLSDNDSHSILFVLDMSDTLGSGEEETYEEYDYEEEEEDGEWEPEEKSSSDAPYTFIIMRSEPINKKLTFLGIPCNMQIGTDNKKADDIYIEKGTTALESSIEYTLGINIDRHMKFNTEAFTKLCNIIGGVTFAVPGGIDGIDSSSDQQYLSAKQIEAIISSGSYAGGELQRISTAASIVSAMLNQANGERIAGNLDNSFEALSSMTESNISATDYSNRKYAIKFMLRYSDPEDSNSRSTRAGFITPYGNSEGGAFVADRYFADDIKSIFEPLDMNASEDNEDNTEKETAKDAE